MKHTVVDLECPYCGDDLCEGEGTAVTDGVNPAQLFCSVRCLSRYRRGAAPGRCRLCDVHGGAKRLHECNVCTEKVCTDCTRKVHQLDEAEVDEAWRRGEDATDDDAPARPYRCEDCYLAKVK